MYLIGNFALAVEKADKLPALTYDKGATLVPKGGADEDVDYEHCVASDIYLNCYWGTGGFYLDVDESATININGHARPIKISSKFKKSQLVGLDQYGYGVVKEKDYAWHSWDNVNLYEGTYKRRISGPIGEADNNNFAFYCKDVFCLINMQDDSDVWRVSFLEEGAPGRIKVALPIVNKKISVIYYADQQGVKKIYKLDLVKHSAELLQQINSYLWLDSFRCVGEYLFFMDEGTLFKAHINNLVDRAKIVVDESNTIKRISYTANYMVVLIQDSSELVIIDRKHFEIKSRITLNIDGMKAVDLQGSDIGVAVKFKNIDDLPAEPCWVEYFSEEDLSKGVADIKAKEPENWQVEKQEVGNEGKFNLLLTINEGMSGADFLRHMSHALWATAFKYATHQNQFDKNEFRLGDKNFDGKLTLDLSAYKNLDELEEKALNRILEDAKNSMEGWGPAQPRLWVDVDTDDERPIKLEIIR